MGIGEDGLTKGWVCGVAEKKGDWLGSSTGPHTKRSMDGKVRPVVQQSVDLSWVQVTTSVECTKKYQDTSYSGKELRTQQERSPSKL
jgi:hypothetical protein